MNPSETRTDRIDDRQLDEIVRRLVEALAPQRIIFFGSHAYGEPHADSDVDLMILFADGEDDRFELSKKAYAALRGFVLPVELHFRSVDRFDRWATVRASFEQEVRDKGRVVYAAEG